MISPDPTTIAASGAPGYRRGPHWVAVFAAVFTLPLLFVGGSVTTYRVGMAVPDWPTTFGMNMFMYDFWNAPFGVRVEHTQHERAGTEVDAPDVMAQTSGDRTVVDHAAGPHLDAAYHVFD